MDENSDDVSKKRRLSPTSTKNTDVTHTSSSSSSSSVSATFIESNSEASALKCQKMLFQKIYTDESAKIRCFRSLQNTLRKQAATILRIKASSCYEKKNLTLKPSVIKLIEELESFEENEIFSSEYLDICSINHLFEEALKINDALSSIIIGFIIDPSRPNDAVIILFAF